MVTTGPHILCDEIDLGTINSLTVIPFIDDQSFKASLKLSWKNEI